MHFGLLQKFKRLLPTVRDLAVPFHSAVPSLALSSPKDLRFFHDSSILSLGEHVLNWTGGKQSRTGTVPQSCLLLVKEGDGHLAWAWFPAGRSCHPEGLGSTWPDQDSEGSWTLLPGKQGELWH